MAQKVTPQFLLLPIDEIELLEDNPREINEKEFKDLCNDIRKDPNFLMQRPPLVNLITKENRKIAYAGNQRLKAAKHNGLNEIWVWVENDVPKTIQQERMLKDNLHRGEWNFNKLLEFDHSWLSDIGFKNADLSKLNSMNIPNILTADKKGIPPTIKITFSNTSQMNKFEALLKTMLNDFEGAIYSISEGEI